MIGFRERKNDFSLNFPMFGPSILVVEFDETNASTYYSISLYVMIFSYLFFKWLLGAIIWLVGDYHGLFFNFFYFLYSIFYCVKLINRNPIFGGKMCKTFNICNYYDLIT